MADVRTPWYQSYPKDVPYTIDKPPYQNLGQMFDDVCNKYGKRKAFISFNSAVTFLDVKKATDNLAAYLQHCVAGGFQHHCLLQNHQQNLCFQ